MNTHAVPLLIQNPRNATDSHRHDTFRICLDDSGLDYVDRTLQWGVGRDLLCLTYVCPVHPLKCSAHILQLHNAHAAVITITSVPETIRKPAFAEAQTALGKQNADICPIAKIL